MIKKRSNIIFKFYSTKKKIMNNKPVLFVPNISHIGRCSYSAKDICVYNPKNSTIGSFVSIGHNVRIGHGTHPINYLTTSPYLYLNRLKYKNINIPTHNEYENIKPVHIGNDVWIGDNVWIKNGITVGDGAIIGACSVVTHDVPPYAIVVGNPAKVLKYRFSEEIISDLLTLKWWDLPDKVIKTLQYDDINECIKQLKKIRNKNVC